MVAIWTRYACPAACRLNGSIRSVELYNSALTFLAGIKNSKRDIEGSIFTRNRDKIRVHEARRFISRNIFIIPPFIILPLYNENLENLSTGIYLFLD